MSTPPLTLRQAREAGHDVTVYCMGSCRCGRPFDLAKVAGSAIEDEPLTDLAERRAFRCSKCGSRGPITVIVSRERVGVYDRVAEFEQG